MMKIQLVVLGKLKESYWREAEAEYLKRLKQYAAIEIIELPEESFRDGVADRERVRTLEAEKVLKRVAPDAFLIALHERGKEFDSVGFAAQLEQWSSQGQHLVFAIGGPLGWHDSVLQRANVQLSLSALTFPHQMTRIVLLEQLYRAGTIQSGKQYHY